MRIPLYQVDAFTGELFAGNPAAVCPLDEWLPDATMQAIATENNLSETAFVVETAGRRKIRWFSPHCEVELCGHATLATAHVLFSHLDDPSPSVEFHSMGGTLTVRRDGEWLVMDFPSKPPTPCDTPLEIVAGIGSQPVEVLESANYMAVLENEVRVKAIDPDLKQLGRLGAKGLIVTAPGVSCDFVSRYFAPAYGIAEDPVTGSTHCELIPYWAKRLGKTDLHAKQVSRRGGELRCRDAGERVDIAGRAVTYLVGHIEV